MATSYRSLIKTVSFSKKTEQEVLDFVNAQANFSDTVLFLIQKEICTNGISNLQQYIPSTRTIADVQRLINQGNSNPLPNTSDVEYTPSADVATSDATASGSLHNYDSVEDVKENVEESELNDIPPELIM